MRAASRNVVTHARRAPSVEKEREEKELPSSFAPIRAARRHAIRRLREAMAHDPSPRVRANARALLDRWSSEARA